MTDLHTLIVRNLQLRRLAEKVAQFAATVEADRIKTEQAIREQMHVGDKKTAAVETPDATVPVGWAHLKNGPAKAPVTDESALLQWVKANRPTEVVTAEYVRPSYLKALQATAKREGGAVDHKTGEAIPGIEVIPGAPVLAFHIEEDGLPALEADARFAASDRAQLVLRSLLTEGDPAVLCSPNCWAESPWCARCARTAQPTS